ncbi:MAG: C-terminal helicase domain-containing protein, partial [Dehalococcoidia bacterium]|nr:C-terminal helicase domain-containing protein [Dehalococcoidia bacterium]
PPIARLVGRYMRDAVEVSVNPGQQPASGVQQYFCEVAERDKILALRYLYEQMDLGRSLIFRRTRIGVDRLTAQLQDAGVAARAIHGDLRQSERDRVMADFRSGRLDFLVATNVAARGLDIPDIEHVINYDIPQNPEEYIHRVGRTARAGKTGASVSFVSEWELTEWDRIVASLEGPRPEQLELPSRW